MVYTSGEKLVIRSLAVDIIFETKFSGRVIMFLELEYGARTDMYSHAPYSNPNGLEVLIIASEPTKSIS